MTLLFTLIGLCVAAFSAFALPPMNLPYGVTPISHEVYHLHMTILYICCAIGIVVFGVMIYSLVKFRKSKGAVSHPIHTHLGVEILWTVIPFIILIIMAIPATRVLFVIHDTSKPALNIKITGYQWKWKYEYLDQNISFFSQLSTPLAEINNTEKKDKWYLLEVDHQLVLPTNEKIRFYITSNDVIHSWWVPDLGLKEDAVPGYINDIWAIIDKPGTYRGQCAELCGANHGFMPIVIKAVTPAEFQTWVLKQQGKTAQALAAGPSTLSHDDLMTMGKAAYEKNCSACHQVTGAGMPPTFPALKNSPVATGPVQKQIQIVLHGVKNTAMQAFGDQLDNQTIAAIITYTRNAWGNDDANKKAHQATDVQVDEVQKARS